MEDEYMKTSMNIKDLISRIVLVFVVILVALNKDINIYIFITIIVSTVIAEACLIDYEKSN